MIRKIIIIIGVLIFSLISYFYLISQKKIDKQLVNKDDTYSSNLLENIKYIARDDDGNEYVINAEKGEIDLDNSEIIFLKGVKSLASWRGATAGYKAAEGFILGRKT